MTKQDLIEYCLTYPSVYEDYPFDDITAVMRHSGNKKTFALIINKDERLFINLKCEPNKADFLRSIFESVIPGWHMNKEHWNTVYIDGDVPEQELYEMIQHSYDLIKPKTRKIRTSAKEGE
jgi:predicted DNA-binding protein (MmcQ/YjbR family)